MKKFSLFATSAALMFSASANAWWGTPGWAPGYEPNTPYFYGFGPTAAPVPGAAAEAPQDSTPATPGIPYPAQAPFGPGHMPEFGNFEERRKAMEAQREALRKQFDQYRPASPFGDQNGFRQQMEERHSQWNKAVEARREAMRKWMDERREAARNSFSMPQFGPQMPYGQPMMPFGDRGQDVEQMRKQMDEMRQSLRDQVEQMKPARPAAPERDAMIKAMEERHEAMHKQMQERRAEMEKQRQAMRAQRPVVPAAPVAAPAESAPAAGDAKAPATAPAPEAKPAEAPATKT